MMNQTLTWNENQKKITYKWLTEFEFSPPKNIYLCDDTLKADVFYSKASEGAAYIWRGDFQNAKLLLQAVQRRIKKSKSKITSNDITPAEQFHKYRQAQSHRAQLLSRLLVEVNSKLNLDLPRAPEIEIPIKEAYPDIQGPFVISLRELLGLIGAHEWRKKGIYIPSLKNKIYPYYGVFSPIRGEYLNLIEKAPLPPNPRIAFDIGTGTGVIAALLASRGFTEVIATETNPRALNCAKDNLTRLGLSSQVKIQNKDMFPEGTADLIVCNPPWVPARPTSSFERAVYDENNQMLTSFVKGLGTHLRDTGEAWLILSDLAEHLGLRPPDYLKTILDPFNLKIIDVLEAKPVHQKSEDEENPLYFARSKETTRLWRICKK